MALYGGFGAPPRRQAPPVVRNSWAQPTTGGYLGSKAFVGTQTRAYREQHPAAPAGSGAPGATPAGGSAAPTWTPPPLGSYDPTRDVEIEQGRRGVGHIEDEANTTRARDISDYWTQRQGIETGQAREGQDFSTQQANLQRAYDTLAGRQSERAGQYGVLSGGALLQAAAKRAANQGRESAVQQTDHQRRVDDFTRQLAALDLGAAPPDEANPLGGREFQDLGSHVANAQADQAFYESGQHRLEGSEAAKAGYELPPAVVAALGGPAAVAALSPPKPPAAAPAAHKPPAKGKAPPAHKDPFRRFRHGL